MHPRILLLSLTGFFVSTSIFMIAPMFSVYAYEYVGARAVEVGVISAAAFLTALFIRIPFSVGLKTEYFHVALIGGLAANSIALAGYGFSENIPTLLFFRVIHGAAVALDYTLMLTLSSMIAPGQTDTTSSIESYSTSLALGLVMGPALGSLLLTFMDLRALMFVSSAIGLGAVLSGILFARSIHGFWYGLQVGRIRIRDVARLLRSRRVMAPAATYFSFTLAYGAFIAYIPLRAKIDLMITDQDITTLFSTYYLIVFLARLFIGRLRKRFGSVKLLYSALTMASLGLITSSLAPTYPLLVAGFMMTGVSHGLIFPITASVAARTTPPDLRNLGNAAYLTSFDVGNIIGPSVTSLLVGFAPISLSVALMAASPLLGMLTVPVIRRLGIP